MAKRGKAITPWIIAFILILVVVLIAQNANNAEPRPAPKKTLSELQMTACTAADNGGTCTTKLSELGFVLPEDCCEALGKCCQ
ncbi:hypothetical protein HY491_00410 [Candidatus Woesearchaeota archaeon]|nr:hypothetical protein [Candidatus Woesearchaeota archaeon]